MTKDQVFSVLKKYIMEQLEDEVEEKDIVITKSMVDLGANSLDIVEIVSNTMRELKIKIPRDELAKIDTMDGLVARMAEYTETNA
ncbi:MAG TPA: phosphopantetheine-binding protein [Spirochaetota bacterium]|jgi:acyl carrier protein|nr:MAG: acyl carrier protein [Spirochaetes bacterium ADurb.Bin133]HOF01958.1 phosphopantetheine-binding protein [Spirochaetota bacterium]HOS33745.1 phosphopantetheine-binding protein [Spirochaetota bacterium]HOS56783.1 phosphopantetheine-binding protein [Spirochaetota bacterium]HPY88537.1 phosphopantetheine-binding protein [Spirochaetota bacterium]